ncbi:MAG: hypothetical protein HZB16_23765 [Armatimonadetes bacterium]|nr:hypothetical protein [Armatimonadota bacterium]
MAAKSTRDLVRNLQLAAAGQADLVVKPAASAEVEPQPTPEPAPAPPAESAPEPRSATRRTKPAPVAPPEAESERPATQRVRAMSLPELKEAYGMQVPDDESICQYTIRVPKWLRHVIAQQCMLRGLSSQDFGMLAVQMLLEEMADGEPR